MNLLEHYQKLEREALNPKHKRYAREMINKIKGKKFKFEHERPGFRLKYYCGVNQRHYQKISEVALDFNMSVGMVWNMLNETEVNLIQIRKV